MRSPSDTADLHERHRQAAWDRGSIEAYEHAAEREMLEEQRRKVVAEWQPARIAGLKDRCKIPNSRISALLGISRIALFKLGIGDFTPSAALCMRMRQLEEAADRGELHSGREYIPKAYEMRRRLANFRAWWLARKPTQDFPLIRVEVSVQWGQAAYERMRLPLKSVPALRMTRWDALTHVMKTYIVTTRKLAQANARLYWTEIEKEFWDRYAKDTLPQIVLERSQIVKKAAAASRKGKTNGVSTKAGL